MLIISIKKKRKEKGREGSSSGPDKGMSLTDLGRQTCPGLVTSECWGEGVRGARGTSRPLLWKRSNQDLRRRAPNEVVSPGQCFLASRRWLSGKGPSLIHWTGQVGTWAWKLSNEWASPYCWLLPTTNCSSCFETGYSFLLKGPLVLSLFAEQK